MINPVILQHLAEIQHAERIAEAERYRRARHAARITRDAPRTRRPWWWKVMSVHRVAVSAKEL